METGWGWAMKSQVLRGRTENWDLFNHENAEGKHRSLPMQKRTLGSRKQQPVSITPRNKRAGAFRLDVRRCFLVQGFME